MRTIALVTALLVVSFAGCTSQNETQSEPAQVLPFDGAYRTEGSHDAVLMELPYHENGSVAAYTYAIPESALTTDAFGSPSLDLHIQVPESVDEAMIFVFDGTSQLDVLAAGVIANFTIEESGILTSDLIYSFNLNLDDSHVNKPLYFVAAARSSEDAWMGITFREDDSRRQLSQFKNDTIALEPLGTGTGVQAAIHLDISLLAAYSQILSTPWVDVEERLDVPEQTAATVRDTTLSSTAGPGFSTTVGAYLGYEAHGTWSYHQDLHGNEGGGSGIIAQDWAQSAVLVAEAILFGLPIWAGISEGNASTESSMDVFVTNVNVLDLLLYQHLWFGASMEDLVGVPVRPGLGDALGLVQDVPYIDGNQLIIPGAFDTVIALPGFAQES